jgi:transposase
VWRFFQRHKITFKKKPIRGRAGARRRGAVTHYEVSPSTAVIWMKCFRETGRCAAKPRGGSTSPLEKHADFLLALIAVEPDLTLDEVVCAMGKLKIPGSRRGAVTPTLDARTRPVRSSPSGVYR